MSRLQLALDVDDLDASIGYYTALLGTEPAKIRPGYANFAVSDPPLKLVLIERPGHGGGVNHLGIEVGDTAAVETAQERLTTAGLTTRDERDVTCCYALQDKFWVNAGPDGEQWEIYTVLADADVMTDDTVAPEEGCCSSGSDEAAAGEAATGEACCSPATGETAEAVTVS